MSSEVLLDDEDTLLSPRGIRWPHLGFTALLAVLFLTFLDNTVLSAALETIFLDLHATIPDLQWIVGAYALSFAALMLTAGSLGDTIGRRKIMLMGIALFSAGSLVCALASTATMLVIGRIIMGIGAAGSEPSTLSMIRHIYPDAKKRARAMGSWVAVSGLALAMGPVIGATLVGLWGWRSIFYFNLAFGVAIFVMVSASLPETRRKDRARLDFPGIVLGASALGMATYATITGESQGYGSHTVVTLYVVSIVVFLAFLAAEALNKQPMLDLTFFRNRDFSTTTYIAFASNFSIFSIFFFVALYLEVIAQAHPFDLALDFVPLLGGMMLASVSTGKWISSVGPRLPMTLGSALAAVGIGITNLFISPTAGVNTIGWSMCLTGVGIGMLLVPVTTSALSSVPKSHSGVAASVINTSRQLGALFGVSILGSIVNGQINQPSVGYVNALTNGLTYALNVSLALMIASFIASLTNKNQKFVL